MKKNKPRVFSNTIKIRIEIVYLEKVFLLYVITEKMINVLRGQYNHLRCYMIIKKKLFIMIMQW